jgi:hypothetical protein
MVADDLRRQADAFIDLTELKPKLGRDPSERSAPRAIRQQSSQLPSHVTINGNDLTS